MLRAFSISKPRNSFGIEFASSALPNRAGVERAVVEQPGTRNRCAQKILLNMLSKNDFQSGSQPFRVSLDASVSAVDGPGLHEKS